mmetsp:Transcript_1510/g.3246  ORF Transcript_1510/g.3246 Transcript_1510/m.3246 type:complete len:270 (+) Transcript_1510:209-1018(+)
MPDPPQSLHSRRSRWCSQMPDPPQSLHMVRRLLCAQICPPLQSLQRLRRRLCSQICDPPQSRHTERWRPCSQMEAPPHSLHMLRSLPCSQIEAPPHSLHLLRCRPCSHSLGPPSLRVGVEEAELEHDSDEPDDGGRWKESSTLRSLVSRGETSSSARARLPAKDSGEESGADEAHGFGINGWDCTDCALACWMREGREEGAKLGTGALFDPDPDRARMPSKRFFDSGVCDAGGLLFRLFNWRRVSRIRAMFWVVWSCCGEGTRSMNAHD